jgi:two-component system, LytTR family, response regulator
MIVDRLRAVIADDERPARAFLRNALRKRPDVEVVGEAESGIEAVRLIERVRPDVAFLDLQMPELDGFEVLRLIDRRRMPFVVFVTAYEEHAVKAFELNAVDYLLKPVSSERLAEAITRLQERLDRVDQRSTAAARFERAAVAIEPEISRGYLERIPVRRRDDFTLVPVKQLATIVAEGELVHLTTTKGDRYTITYRLKDLEARLDPGKFIRIGRGTLVASDLITRVQPLPGGLHVVTLSTGEELQVSRIQSRMLRERFLKL